MQSYYTTNALLITIIKKPYINFLGAIGYTDYNKSQQRQAYSSL